MDIFKLFESTVPEIQLDHNEAKDLRRDQLLDNYDAAVKALQCLIKAKENEIAYRRALVEMLEQSKAYYDKKSCDTLENVGKYIPDQTLTLDKRSETPQSNQSTTPKSSGNTPAAPTTPSTIVSSQSGDHRSSASNYQPAKNSDLDLSIHQPAAPDRTSLDNRLTEFLKTYPILSQAGISGPATSTTDNNMINNSNNVRPSPGYYTQQPPPPPPPSSMTAAPPLMAMMRYPPPPLIPLQNQQPPSLSNLNLSSQENHETADMDLSDHDEPTGKAGMIPMIASAMQQGAGGKQGHPRNEQSPYGAGGYNNSVQYTTSRMSTLPFDPSIMDPTFSSPISSGSSTRDKHSHTDRGSHKHSSSSGSGGSKHGSDKSSKYSSSSQSSKNKRR